MRLRRAALAVLVAGPACANLGEPPGGPPDVAPPVILAIRPESGGVVPDLKDALEIRFDEVVEESPGAAAGAFGGGGASSLAALVLLSPVAGPVNVSWHRSTIRVKPREGWQPGRVYRLELLAGISDLRRNRTPDGRTVIFSTGPPLPGASLGGRTVLWAEQTALVGGLIVAAPVPDTIGYLALTDSSGAFRLDGIPPGDYVVHAVQDANGNRRRDRREAYDSVLVTVDSGATVALWAFVHDTTGPRLRQTEVVDSLTLRLTFTQPLDVTAPLTADQVTVLALPDSTPAPLAAVLTVAQYDTLVERARAAADAARAAAADSARRAAGDTAAPAAAGPPAEKPPIGPRPGAPGARPAAPDSVLRALLAQRPAPSDRRVVRLAAPLAPDTRYLVRVRGAANLTGATADGQAVFHTPKAPPPEPAAADTAAARDTTPPAPRDSSSGPPRR